MIGSVLLVGFMHLFVVPQHNVGKSIILISIAISLPIGFRPVIALFAIPDTLYLYDRNLCLSNGEIIDIQNVDCVTINLIGF